MPDDSPQTRALLFDMDGVLIDSEPLWRRAEIEIFGGVGLELTEGDCAQTQGLRIDDAVAYWFTRSPWKKTSCEEIAQAIVRRVGELIRSDGKPLPGVHESIEEATRHGWRIGLASSSSHELIDTVLDHFDLTEAFEVRLSAETEPFGKPHPAVYLAAAGSLAIPATRCIAIEDSLNGVISALAAQMKCIAIPAPESQNDPKFRVATLQLSSLTHLAEALTTL